MVAVRQFGTFEGKRVDQFTLTSTTGVEVDVINWGAVVRDWRVPVKGGKRSVVLGFDKFEDYPAHSPYFGAIAGRVANRIGNATFELGGKSYKIDANEGPNSLHGGPKGLSRQVWDASPDDATNSMVFSIESPDGHSGYPGNVRIKATYRLDGNTLRLEFGATTDRPTPLSLVQHHYFNLGTGNDVLDHSYWFAANAFTEVDAKTLIPSGNIIEAKPGTQWNFRTPRNLRDSSGAPIEYDGNLVLDSGRDLKDPAGIVKSPEGDLTMKIWTDRPGMQFYNSVMMGKIEGKGVGGKSYGKFSGFCTEDQSFPDAVNHPHFPSVIITPDKPYAHWCEIEIA
jgi:aldose 1-epimerase